MMFVHGVGPREPWNYDAEFLRLFRELAQLRILLRLYLTTLAEAASRTGAPMMRPLLFEFQHDRNTWNIEDCFRLGDAVLVIPLFDGSGRRTFYLPADEWHTITSHPERTPVYPRTAKFFPVEALTTY